MHKLKRGAAPNCLTKYRHGRDNWNSVNKSDKTEIWQELKSMQGNWCAYCERRIDEGQRHIEHFLQRRSSPQATFQWGNLFGSCNDDDSCGRFKDSCGKYLADDLIKPDIEDPDDFLIFVPDGTIAVKKGLNAALSQRANETLRIFNLDAQNGALRQMRRNNASRYLDTAEALWKMREEYGENVWEETLADELKAAQDEQFITAIRHTICRLD